jgi:hypothetical protein
MRTSIAWGALALVAAACWVGTTIGADTPGLKSGLQVGNYAQPFDVEDVTGPNQGLTLCYR